MPPMHAYLVIGIYADNHQRYADTFDASTPDEAEEMAQDAAKAAHTSLIIAGVLRDGQVVA